MIDGRRVPAATYRLQLRPHLGFAEVARLAPYLAGLGVSHVYLSPCLQAAPGSSHGYDVVDHDRADEELGGTAAFEAMCEALRAQGLGVVVDIVPNHMSIADPELNPWWWDVLENGPSSLYAHFFDVDWPHPNERRQNRVLVPILGDQYGRVLHGGGIRVARLAASFRISAADRNLPVAPISLAVPLSAAAARCGSEDLGFAADALRHLPAPTATDGDSLRRRHRDKAAIGRFLSRLLAREAAVVEAVDAEIDHLNADHDALHELLEQQNYRLAYWRLARHDLDYRRFFDINELAALRMEDEDVFHATHRLIVEWVARGLVHGLRVDHPDGLRDPEAYFRRLRRAAPGAWTVAEKILEDDEELPEAWPIEGTTGYDFLSLTGGLFVDGSAEEALTAFHSELVGGGETFEALARAKKRLVLREILASDLARLTATFAAVCEANLEHRDYPGADLRAALEEVLVWLPVYRTYVRCGHGPTARDAALIAAATARARAAQPGLEGRLFDFLAEVLVGARGGDAAGALVSGFQQLSGAAMAKGIEDTAFYCYPRLLCLNEVGGSPGRFGTTLQEFHERCRRNGEKWPAAMLATSTHDTKRSEDARIRMALISEVPQRWIQCVRDWRRLGRRHRSDESTPDPAMEYTLYQTLVGAWPISEERLVGYMLKAAREAKVHTWWTRTNETYERALAGFCAALIADRDFVSSLEAFLAPLAQAACVHSLSQTLLKLCAPGVPDIYQGNELWDFSLTDPDNRRPVDFARRAELLAALETLAPAQILARAGEGLPKLYVTQRALHLRRRRAAALAPGADYLPLLARGAAAPRVVAFARGGEVVAVAPRLTANLDSWADTALALPDGSWRNILSGDDGLDGTVELERLLSRFPVALLERSG